MRDPHNDPLMPEGEDDAALMRQLFPLDDATGPAPRRSAADLDAIINAALDAHPNAPPPPPSPAPRAAPSLGLLLAATALLLAALTALWLSTGRPPAPAPAPSSPWCCPAS